MVNNEKKTDRRRFLGTLASGAALAGLSTLPSVNLNAADDFVPFSEDDPEAWFKKIKGKHRIVFDATQPHEIMPFAWPRVFLMTNEMTGTPAKDQGVVVVLRHSAIGYAMEDKVWEKYKLGELFKADDPATKKASLRNPFWKPAKGAFNIPGVGEVAIGINELQDSGVMFCVCNVALGVYSAVAAQTMNLNHADVLKEWKAALLPGIQVVPSGVWALGRAQENGCKYIFAG